MTTKSEVEQFLSEFKTKMSIFRIFFRDDRGKNAQALLDLEITPQRRMEIIAHLTQEDYSEGPIEEQLHGLPPMWVFGKAVKGTEVYIKITMGAANSSTICISFHPAEYAMNYPFKTNRS